MTNVEESRPGESEKGKSGQSGLCETLRGCEKSRLRDGRHMVGGWIFVPINVLSVQPFSKLDSPPSGSKKIEKMTMKKTGFHFLMQIFADCQHVSAHFFDKETG